MEELRDAKGMTEAESIAYTRSQNYPKPSLTADVVLFSRKDEKLTVLLIRRKGHPFLGRLAFPGGFANENEPIEETAARELEEETGVTGIPMKLIDIFSRPGRDPRGWTVSAAYVAMVNADELSVQAGDDAAEALWYEVRQTDEGISLVRENETPVKASELAFDHEDILRKALEMERK